MNRQAEITVRNDIARDIIAGFAAVTPTLAGARMTRDAPDQGVCA